MQCVCLCVFRTLRWGKSAMIYDVDICSFLFLARRQEIKILYQLVFIVRLLQKTYVQKIARRKAIAFPDYIGR